MKHLQSEETSCNSKSLENLHISKSNKLKNSPPVYPKTLIQYRCIMQQHFRPATGFH
jgi:hypothetical protein